MISRKQVVFRGYTIFNLRKVRDEHEHVCVAAQRIRPRPLPRGNTQASSQASPIDATQHVHMSKSM